MSVEQATWFGDATPQVICTPATSANLGPGFDCLGLALDFENELWVKPSVDAYDHITVEGFGNADSATSDNLILQAYHYFFKKLDRPAPPVTLHSINRVPFARGLGSSSAAIVSGLAAAQIMSDFALSKDALIRLAVEMDGHPDNVLPALVGGFALACETADQQLHYYRKDPPPALKPYVIIPDYALSTEAARAALPTSYSRSDTVFNLGHMGLLMVAMMSDDLSLLSAAMDDRIHQSYRLDLMPGMREAGEMAKALGALAVAVSGAGSTILLLCDREIDFSEIIDWLAKQNIRAELKALTPSQKGVRYIRNEVEVDLCH